MIIRKVPCGLRVEEERNNQLSCTQSPYTSTSKVLAKYSIVYFSFLREYPYNCYFLEFALYFYLIYWFDEYTLRHLFMVNYEHFQNNSYIIFIFFVNHFEPKPFLSMTETHWLFNRLNKLRLSTLSLELSWKFSSLVICKIIILWLLLEVSNV